MILDRETTDRNYPLLERLSSELSRKVQCPALAVLVHDDATLLYLLYEDGKRRDRYMSSPHYFQSGLRALLGAREDAPPEGGNAEALCRAFATEADRSEISQILRAPTLARVLAQANRNLRATIEAGAQVSADTARAIQEAGKTARFRFEFQRHAALVHALGIPAVAVATGYEDVTNRDRSEATADAFVHT